MAFESGVFPVFDIVFKISATGASGEPTTEIADMESFSIAIDGNTVTWNPMDQKGWSRALMTGKKLTISLKGKRNVGDAGNDYVASTAFKDGLDCSTKASVEFPDGSKLTFNCVLDVKNLLGGESQDVAPLEFDMICDGKPTFTESEE
jgi:predicted secreted protein